MLFFTSSYTQKVDKKGRTSVPSRFRATLEDGGFSGIALHYVKGRAYIDGSDEAFLKVYHNRIANQFNEDMPKKRKVARRLLGGSAILPFDSEGRVMLPAKMRAATGITNQVTFVGVGDSFELWAPEALEFDDEDSDTFIEEAVDNIPALFDQ